MIDQVFLDECNWPAIIPVLQLIAIVIVQSQCCVITCMYTSELKMAMDTSSENN